MGQLWLCTAQGSDWPPSFFETTIFRELVEFSLTIFAMIPKTRNRRSQRENLPASGPAMSDRSDAPVRECYYDLDRLPFNDDNSRFARPIISPLETRQTGLSDC
jgi:hypothetical protein